MLSTDAVSLQTCTMQSNRCYKCVKRKDYQKTMWIIHPNNEEKRWQQSDGEQKETTEEKKWLPQWERSIFFRISSSVTHFNNLIMQESPNEGLLSWLIDLPKIVTSHPLSSLQLALFVISFQTQILLYFRNYTHIWMVPFGKRHSSNFMSRNFKKLSIFQPLELSKSTTDWFSLSRSISLYLSFILLKCSFRNKNGSLVLSVVSTCSQLFIRSLTTS